MKYKVGDRVRIVSEHTKRMNIDGMSKYLGTIMTISDIVSENPGFHYCMMEDDGYWCWDDDMIEGLAEDEMSAVELLEWFCKHYTVCADMCETFGHNYYLSYLLENFSIGEIISRIQEFERNHTPKKMTVAEIEEQLGYKIEIIAGEVS